MSAELALQTPVNYLFARTLVNRAWLQVQRKYIWSFLWGKVPIPTPSPTTIGSVTLTSGSATVIADANATTAWANVPGATPLSQQQFRIGTGTFYNIVTYNPAGAPPFATLTLDYPFVDPLPEPGANVGVVYQIYQVYYNAPVADFLWWESITDPVSGYAMRNTLTNEEVDRKDPQRFQSGWPIGPIPYRVNPLSGTFNGYPMFEMWPAPLNNITYVGEYWRRGSLFVNDTDTVNPMLGEDVVLELAKYWAYEWALAQPQFDQSAKRSWQFLMGGTQRMYAALLNDYILKDEEFSHRHVINQPEDAYIEALPWVSQREGLGYFPD